VRRKNLSRIFHAKAITGGKFKKIDEFGVRDKDGRGRSALIVEGKGRWHGGHRPGLAFGKINQKEKNSVGRNYRNINVKTEAARRSLSRRRECADERGVFQTFEELSVWAAAGAEGFKRKGDRCDEGSKRKIGGGCRREVENSRVKKKC